jgi:C4-dicarboxylate transporter, DctQ subunit
MTQQATQEQRYLSAFKAFEHNGASGDPTWLRELRRSAMAQFEQAGFPTARRGNEPWKYTDAPVSIWVDASFRVMSDRFAVEDYLLLVLFVAMTGIMVSSVTSRFLLTQLRIARVDQLLPDMFVWMSMLGAATAIRHRSHLGLLALIERLSPRWSIVTSLLTTSVGLAFFGVLAWHGLDSALFQYRQGSRAPTGYPAWWIGAAMPVASLFAIWRLIEASVRDIRRRGERADV